MKILIVEDEFLIAMALEEVLLDLGHEAVGPAATYEEAMALAEDVDIAVVDVRLQDGFTGPDVGQSLTERHGTTVIFTTGNPEAVYSSRAGLAVLPKPYHATAIKQAIAYAIAVRQGRPSDVPKQLVKLPA